jgi:ParB family chromosome partitioning protein
MSDALDRLFLGSSPGPDTEPAPEAEPPRLNLSTTDCRDIPIDTLVDMEQPFHLYGEDAMEAMRQSVSVHGVLQRLIVRPWLNGDYQIISGRNRRTAARLAGFTTVPCEVRQLDDDEAELQMLETNLTQREQLLPSEKAWAYRKRLEALKRQGRKAEGTSCQFGTKLRSDETIAKELPESARTMQRFIRLTYLISPFLDAVDTGKLNFGSGVTLSFLSEENQKEVYDYFYVTNPGGGIDGKLAELLRQAGEKGPLDAEKIETLLFPTVKKPKAVRSVPARPFRKYFPKETSLTAMQRTMLAALKEYFEGGGQILKE